LVGPRAPVKGRDGRTAPHPSSTMSSGRLFLDRVARQHCPSPLHRRDQTNTHFRNARSKPDISTLRRIGHFYFALTQPSYHVRSGVHRPYVSQCVRARVAMGRGRGEVLS
jgi:hypothetical protein